MTTKTDNIKLPISDEAAAHMYPSDLKKFEFGEHTATAFSIAVGCPSETSQPLFTLDQVRAAIALDRQQRGEPVDPYSEWADYAKRSGLLNDDGVASEPARAQTAWNAFSFAWNRSYRVNATPQPTAPVVKDSLTVAEPWPADWIAQLNSEYARGLEDGAATEKDAT